MAPGPGGPALWPKKGQGFFEDLGPSVRTRALDTSASSHWAAWVDSSRRVTHSQVSSWPIIDPEAMARRHLSPESAALPQPSAPPHSSPS